MIRACSIVLTLGIVLCGCQPSTPQDAASVLMALVARGGLITIPPGTYRIDKPLRIELTKFTAIRGEGVVRIVMAGPGPAIQLIGTHAGTAAPNTVKPNVWANERMPSVDGVEIVGDHEQADGIEASGTMQLTLTRLNIRSCRHGIHLVSRNRNVQISDCHVYDNRGIGVFLDAVNLHQINVVGCHVSYNQGGGIVAKAGEVRNLQITGCDLEANHAANGPPTANVWIDSTGGSHAEVAITGNTIQHTNKAPESANIRIQGPSNPLATTDERRDGHVTITGNILSDVQVNVHLLHARSVVITGNTFWTAYAHNLLVEQSANVVVGANAFDRNPRYSREESPTTTNAIRFVQCRDCTISGVHLVSARAAKAGLHLEACDRMNVNNCTILDCEPIGVLAEQLTRSRIAGCVIRDDRMKTTSKSLVVSGTDNTVTDNVLIPPVTR